MRPHVQENPRRSTTLQLPSLSDQFPLPQSILPLSKPTTTHASSAQSKLHHSEQSKEKIRKCSTAWRKMIKGEARRKVFVEKASLRVLEERVVKQQVERPSVLQEEEEILFPNAEQWKQVVAEAMNIASEQQRIKSHAAKREDGDRSLKLALKEAWKKKKERDCLLIKGRKMLEGRENREQERGE